MTEKDFKRLAEFRVIHNAMLPVNESARELVEYNVGRTLMFQEKTNRDIKKHRAYFKILEYVYSWLPVKFTAAVPLSHFYQWLKHFNGQYQIVFEFKDGTHLIEYESISFARMSEPRFNDYVKNQLTIIYNDVIRPLCPNDANIIIENIEHEFENYLNTL